MDKLEFIAIKDGTGEDIDGYVDSDLSVYINNGLLDRLDYSEY